MTEIQEEKRDMFYKIGGKDNFNKLLYGITKGIAGFGLNTIFNLKIEGKYNIPMHNKAILTTISENVMRDIFVISQATGRQIHFMLSPKIMRNQMIGPILKTLGMFRSTESKEDKEPIEKVFDYLNNKNDLVAMTPEAKLDYDIQIKAMSAIIKFAAGVNVPIIPLTINIKKGKIFNMLDFNGLVLKIGTPLNIEKKIGRDKYRDQRYELAEGIIKIIDSLRKPKNNGAKHE
ncbi:MAG: hypothetical protein KGD63_04625 [Candidatus Lokiarchaeota archaeon]|nr:hypothetical protein [Candidatus Lokiarchaeota archaeon]